MKEEITPDSSYEVKFHPGSNNDMVITDIAVNDRNKNYKTNRLKLYRNILVETDVLLTDE
ncbi:MAG: hypothetical protein QNJ51_18190 [Calothrix sp. MO_167.B12]|nr:hypothetical protein [Calothrix sp. MO_167.B12]